MNGDGDGVFVMLMMMTFDSCTKMIMTFSFSFISRSRSSAASSSSSFYSSVVSYNLILSSLSFFLLSQFFIMYENIIIISIFVIVQFAFDASTQH